MNKDRVREVYRVSLSVGLIVCGTNGSVETPKQPTHTLKFVIFRLALETVDLPQTFPHCGHLHTQLNRLLS